MIEITEGDILDEILLESRRTQYRTGGSPIYMSTLSGYMRAARAILTKLKGE